MGKPSIVMMTSTFNAVYDISQRIHLSKTHIRFTFHMCFVYVQKRILINQSELKKDPLSNPPQN